MADILMIFPLNLTELWALPVSELMAWRERARLRAETVAAMRRSL
ncbi:MAG: GpE family phage tail protein [Asticcacaulis sp.]